jgi:hypothetical protein
VFEESGGAGGVGVGVVGVERLEHSKLLKTRNPLQQRHPEHHKRKDKTSFMQQPHKFLNREWGQGKESGLFIRTAYDPGGSSKRQETEVESKKLLRRSAGINPCEPFRRRHS